MTVFLGLIRSFVLFLVFATGLSALVYEVAWQRYLQNFLGSAAQATAVILAVFLGGLCLGYLVFGKISRNRSPAQLIAICGLSEIAIGVWAYIFPALYQVVWLRSGVIDPLSTYSVFWELAVALSLIGVPTILMGGTLPLLTQGLSIDLNDARGFHARVYASNTAGAFLGCLLSGFFFLPNWGLNSTIQTIGWFNLAAGLLLVSAAAALPKTLAAEGTEKAEQRQVPPEIRISVLPANVLAFLAGFCSLCLQTVFIRLVGIAMGSSEFAFSMVVAVFVCMLSFGSWLVSVRDSKPIAVWKNQVGIFVSAFLVYLTADYWPYACYLVRLNFASYPETFYLYHAVMFLILAAVLMFPVGMMGATMPRLFASVTTSDEDLGSNVGRLYAWNTFGCVLGALLGGHWLLYIWNLDVLFRICLMLVVLSIIIAIPWSLFAEAKRQWKAVACLVIFAGSVFSLPDWNKKYMASGLFRSRFRYPYSYKGATEFYDNYLITKAQLFYRDGPSTSVAVGENDADPGQKKLNNGFPMVRNLKVNGKSDGETSYSDTRTMRLVTHIPMLLSPKPVKRVGVIGFGLGVAAGSSTLYPEVEAVDVMEISPAVLWAAPLFDFANYGVTKNPKVNLLVGDAYRLLAASHHRYNVIISEPSNPWVTGVERLFAKEFYEIVKAKLESDGIYMQWIHDYSLSNEAVGLVFRTFSSSFPNVRIFRTNQDIVMLGSMKELGEDAVDALFQRYESNEPVRQSLAQVAIANAAELFGLEIWASKEQFQEYQIQTLEFPRLAYMAGVDFFLNNDAELGMMFNDVSDRLWSRAAARRSLIYILMRQAKDPTSVLKSYIRAACDVNQPGFVEGWTERFDNCKTALVALAIDEKLEYPENGPAENKMETLRRLRETDSTPDLSEWMSLVPSVTPDSAESFFELFEAYDSIFASLSVEKLLVISVPCLNGITREALLCRAHLVRTLAVTGYPKLANEVLADLKKEHANKLEPQDIRFVEKLVEAAERADVKAKARRLGAAAKPPETPVPAKVSETPAPAEAPEAPAPAIAPDAPAPSKAPQAPAPGA